jgi:hypothetical protein
LLLLVKITEEQNCLAMPLPVPPRTNRVEGPRGRSSERLMNSDSLSRSSIRFEDLDDGDGDIESFVQNKKGDKWKHGRTKEANEVEMTSTDKVDETRDPKPANTSNGRDFHAQAEKHHRALIVGLLNGRAVWFGGNGNCNIMLDAWFYTCQYHPLLCIFLAHPSHPFARGERAVHLLAMLFFAFFIAAISELNHGDQSIFSTAKILWVVLSNFLLLALDTFMREVVTCSCVQPGGKLQFLCVHDHHSIFF